MTSTPEAMERKIRQLDNDVQSIYEMLSGIAGTQRRHDNRFAEIGADVIDLRSQMSGLREDLTALDTKVAAIDTTVAALDTKVTTLDAKVTTLDAKLDRVIGLLEK